MTGASVQLENITLSFERHPALHHLSGTFASGSLTAITGPNGAGKSTLLKGIAGILKPDSGRIVTDRLTPIAYLPQAAELQRDFPLNVLQMVSLGLWRKIGAFSALPPTGRGEARAALESVGLAGFESRRIGTLSAGQFQRALFARLLLQDAPLILLDEPFAAIDGDTSERLLAIMQRWHAEGRTVLCVLHDLDQIRRYFPQCLLLARTCVAWGPTGEALTPEHLRSARHFHASWEQEAEECAA